MGSRQAQLKNWVQQVWPFADRDHIVLDRVSGDASFRQYFRAVSPSATLIAVDAPPDKENSEPFVTIANDWLSKGIRVPQVISDDLSLGFMLLEDFSDTQLIDTLEPNRPNPYLESLETLLSIQMLPADNLPLYDAAILKREMSLFSDWFLEALLGVDSNDWHTLLDQTEGQLIDSALNQPQVCVHRDYHSRNLMVLPTGQLGVIDFQDALIGPITYDLVSLLRDSYVGWPEQRVSGWVEDYRLMLLDIGFDVPNQAAFKKAFDLMGMQRQLKVLGIFCRLYLRDGKQGYLKNIPRTFGYLLASAQRYSEFADLAEALEGLVLPMKQNQHVGNYLRSDGWSA